MALNEAAVPPRTKVAKSHNRGRLFPKYAALFLAVVALALIPNVISDVWFSYQEQKDLLFRLQREADLQKASGCGHFRARPSLIHDDSRTMTASRLQRLHGQASFSRTVR